ncbi:MAG: ATP-binding protein [Minwuia sp.]|uniref:ATP-binding protein n=1 Tax=Minwuia sp. TaxID=2493630 RepID=UPI003A8BA9D3
MLSRFRDTGVAARLALILMILMLIAVGLSVGWYVKERTEAATKLFAFSATRRIDNIVPLLDKAGVAERRELIRAISGPTLRVRLEAGPPPDDPEFSEHWQAKRHARRMLQRLGDRPLVISRIGDWERPLFGRDDDDENEGRRRSHPEPDILPSRAKMVIATTLDDGQWVHFILATDLTSLRWAVRMAFWVISLGVVIMLFSIWAANRATRPLRKMTEAAERLGLNVDAPPLEETGSREMKKTAGAFNTMQQRIKRLVDDRTLMLAALSHDLKTMLTRLRLRAEFIEDPEQQAKAIRDIDDMDLMVDSALSFVRGDQANETVSRIDLASLVRDMADDHQAQGHDVELSGPEKLPMFGRPVALKRAVGNLIDNAVRYGGQAEIVLDRDEERVTLLVMDGGPGLPEGELEKVFQPFYRVETSRNRDTGGSGLGLAVARDVFRRLGGDLTLANRPGGGLLAEAWLPGDGAK